MKSKRIVFTPTHCFYCNQEFQDPAVAEWHELDCKRKGGMIRARIAQLEAAASLPAYLNRWERGLAEK